MSDVQPIQTSFHVGEISPRLLGRTNLEVYRNALLGCENFYTYSHGPAQMRPGFEYLAQARAPAYLRLVDVELNDFEQYVLEIGYDDGVPESYIRFYDSMGPVTEAENFIQNPYFDTGIQFWVNQSNRGDFFWAAALQAAGLRVNNPNTTAAMEQEVTVADPTVQHTLSYEGVSIGEGAFEIAVGTSPGATDIFSGAGGNGPNSHNFTPGAGNATFFIRFTIDASSPGTVRGQDYYIDDVFLTPFQASYPIYELSAPWGRDDLEKLQWAVSSSGRSVYFASENVEPYVLNFGTPKPLSWTLSALNVNNPPAEWGAGNWPGCVAIFQQRLWFGRTPNEKGTFWGSKLADYLEFDDTEGGGSVLPTTAIAVTMSDRGSIEWLRGNARNLLIGTDVGEYVLIVGEGRAIDPSKVLTIEPQSSYGSAELKMSVDLGNGVVYLSPDRRRVRFMSYAFLEDGWVSQDLTWASEHLTEKRIRELHFKYAPDPIMWGLLENGRLITAVYERERDLIGWHRHTLSDQTPWADPEGLASVSWIEAEKGEVLTMAVLREAQTSRVYVAVKRNIDGNDLVYIERTARALPGQSALFRLQRYYFADDPILEIPDDARAGLLDSSLLHLEANLRFSANVFGHLEGKRVKVVTEAGMMPDQIVTNGTVTVPVAAQVFYVGLGYHATMRTLPLEGLNQAGSSQPLRRRWNRIFLRLYESAIPLVNGVRVGERDPQTPMNRRQPNETFDLQVGNLGRDRLGIIEVVQDTPLDTTIVGIFGDAGADKF